MESTLQIKEKSGSAIRIGNWQKNDRFVREKSDPAETTSVLAECISQAWHRIAKQQKQSVKTDGGVIKVRICMFVLSSGASICLI